MASILRHRGPQAARRPRLACEGRFHEFAPLTELESSIALQA